MNDTRTEAHGLTWESYFLPLQNGARLHLKRIHKGEGGEAVFMLHGSIENGKIFYSNSGRGLGPWLARQGYDVFVADMQGRGESTPAMNSNSLHGMKELMEDEIPAFLRKIHDIKGPGPMHWMAHSWGGVDLLTYLAQPSFSTEVKSMVFFGSKRQIQSRNWRYYWMIGFGWNTLSRISIRRKGYLDAVGYRIGADSISAQTFYDTDRWIRSKEWVHPETKFDYAKHLAAIALPPILYLAGKKDYVLGNPGDVLRLAQETGPADRYRFHVLSKSNQHRHDYGHVDMLTHADAPEDVFPLVKAWMEGR